MMLYEQVEKREKEACGGFTAVTGSCKFCGQVATRKALEKWSQEEIDELATETCECVDARIYVHKKGQMPALIYCSAKTIKGIQEIELPEISAAKEKFIDKLKKLIRTEIFVFIAKHKRKGN